MSGSKKPKAVILCTMSNSDALKPLMSRVGNTSSISWCSPPHLLLFPLPHDAHKNGLHQWSNGLYTIFKCLTAMWEWPENIWPCKSSHCSVPLSSCHQRQDKLPPKTGQAETMTCLRLKTKNRVGVVDINVWVQSLTQEGLFSATTCSHLRCTAYS